MAYRRPGRPTFYAQLRVRKGWRQICLRTPDGQLAKKIEAMWHTLVEDHLAWDVLDHVILGSLPITTLFDHWREAGRNVGALRRLLDDVDLEPLVSDFLAVHKAKVTADTVAHITTHLRELLPAGTPFPRSKATPEILTAALYAPRKDGKSRKPGTRRKVHSDWSVFFAYCTDVRSLFERNPMEKVSRPPTTKPPIRFYELDVVERVVEWQPTDQRKAVFALLYGAGIEVSVVLRLHRSDFNPATKEVRAAGTKAHSRDRVSRIADWAWPIVWSYVKTMTPQTALFDGITRSGVGFWHRQSISLGISKPVGRKDGTRGGSAELVKEALKLDLVCTVHNARDHWAVRSLRSGAPVALVQHQLGHASPTLTLNKYGRFMPSASDRNAWERKATLYETKRREAK